MYTSFGNFEILDSNIWGEPYAINNHRQVVGTLWIYEESNSKILAQIDGQNENKGTNIADMVHRITGTRGEYSYGKVIEMLRNSTFKSKARNVQGERDSFDMNRMYNERLLSVWTEDEQRQIIEIALKTSHRQEAFIWDEVNGFKSLGEGAAYDINDHGQVVGSTMIESGVWREFYWDEEHGKIILPTLGGDRSNARAINNNGQIVGTTTDSAGNTIPVIWEVKINSSSFTSN